MRIIPNPSSYALVLCYLLISTFCLPLGIAYDAAADPLNLAGNYKKIRGQIVQIVVPTPDGTRVSLGTGFWLSEQGLIATCWHVVSGNPTGKIIVQSAIDSFFDLAKHKNINANWQPFLAKVIASDTRNDVAVLKVLVNPFSGRRHPSIKIGNLELTAHYASATLNTDLPDVGTRILMAGYPLGQPYLIMQEGTVAALAYQLPGWGDTNKILISTLANHGNSGAPIFDEQGKVIAILEGEDRAQGQDRERTGISIAIPAFFVSELEKSIGP